MTNRNMRKSKVLTVVGEKQDSRMMEVVVMSREESLFEAMGGTRHKAKCHIRKSATGNKAQADDAF